MKPQRFRILLPMLLILSWVLALASPVPVYAMNEPPPPPSDSGGAPIHPAGNTQTSSGTDMQNPPSPLIEPDGEAVAQAVQDLAEADLVLYNADGTILPLAAQDAVNALGHNVNFYDTGNVIHGYDTIQAAVNAFASDNGKGLIYLAETSYTTPEVTINGVPNLAGLVVDAPSGIGVTFNGVLNISNMPVGFTVRGMDVNANNGSAAALSVTNGGGPLLLQDLDLTNPLSFGLYVYNYNGAITLRNVNVHNSQYGSQLNNTVGTWNTQIFQSRFTNSTLGLGLMLDSKGSVLIEDTNVLSNAGGGASINNHLGTGTVTIKRSNFNSNNSAYGLNIYSNKAVNLDTITATQNKGNGITVATSGGLTVKNSELSHNTLSGSAGYGLSFISSGVGNVTLTDLTVDKNDKGGVSLAMSGQNGDANLARVSLYSNDGTGLIIQSQGNITLNDVNVTYSETAGAILNNVPGTAKNVIINNSEFNYTASGSGLTIASKGMVTLNHIEAQHNAGVGVDIDNSSASSAAPVSLLSTYGPNLLSGNLNQGLLIATKGAVTLNYVSANGNSRGAEISNATSSTFAGVTINNSAFNANKTEGGLYVMSTGAIALSNVASIANLGGGGIGAVLLNQAAAPSPKGVTLNNVTFDRNGSTGLTLYSRGAVAINHISASLNGGSGAAIDNCSMDVTCKGIGTVTLLNTLGNNTFDRNTNATGLNITSGKTVTINQASANYNSSGILINSTLSTTPQAATLKNIEASQNTITGLGVQTLGAITLDHIVANGNIFGINVDNCQWNGSVCRGSGNLSLTGNLAPSMLLNNGTGAILVSSGNVTVSKVTASGSTASDGLRIDHIHGTGTVSLNTVLASDNAGDGVDINSRGTVSLTGINADSNTSNGLYLNNDGAPSTFKPVTISNSSFNGNANGIYLNSQGAISLTNVSANANTSKGMDINNCNGSPCGGSGSVTMNGIQANKNGSFGITLRAAGAVSISNSSASFNSSGIGLSIVNNSSPIMGNITLSNLALNNNNSGLNLITTGSVTMDGVFANGNANFNASIGNASSPIAGIKPISIQNSSFNASSAGYGLIVMSTAPITLNHVLANNNFTFGASVGNCNGAPCTGLGAVSISGASEFSGNKSYGLNILGAGTITLNSVSANQNGTTGISADNSNGTGNVSLSSINTNLNTTQGLSVTTKGAITLTTVTANTNGGNGATLNAPNGTSITVNHGFFNDNGLIGLSSYSKGNQTLNHIVASGNQSMGARIDTCISGTPCTGTGSVTIGNAGGISQFDSNGSTGLTVDSGGKVTMTGFSASNNKAGSGIYITNDKGTGDVVLQTLNASNNSLYGISVSSKGAITLNKTTASSNQGVGVSLNNTAALTSPFPAVTVTNLIANQNSGHNIYITSDGGITLNHVSANGSLTSSGATLINSSGSLTSNINILSTMGSNHFDGNATYGLSIGTSGVTTIKNISAVGNGIVSEADGLRISTTNNVTSIYCSLITGNGKSGIRVTQPATGTVTMTGVSYFGNDLFGGGFDDDLYTNLGSVNAVWTPCTNW